MISIHLIPTFLAYCEEKTAERAAHKLKTTQPTVSRHIKQLEEELGSPLFESRGRKKVLTEFGQELALRLKRRLDGLSGDVLTLSRLHSDGSMAHLRVGARMEILRRHFVDLQWSAKCHLLAMNQSQVRQGLVRGELDVGIAQIIEQPVDYIRKPFFVDQFVVAVPESFFKSEPRSNLNEWMAKAQNYPMAAYSRDLNYISSLSWLPMPSFVFADWEGLEQRLQMGMNWAVLPSSFLRANSSYRVLGIKNSPEQQFYIYYRPSLKGLAWFQQGLRSLQKKTEKAQKSGLI